MRRMSLVLVAAALMGMGSAARAQPSPAAVKANRVLAILTVKAGTPMPEIMKNMQDEVKATVRLYLDGKIEQWYARGDGKGVVFILDCATVDEAKGLTDALPLSRAGIAEFTFMPLGPLTPLRALLGGGAAQTPVAQGTK